MNSSSKRHASTSLCLLTRKMPGFGRYADDPSRIGSRRAGKRVCIDEGYFCSFQGAITFGAVQIDRCESMCIRNRYPAEFRTTYDGHRNRLPQYTVSVCTAVVAEHLWRLSWIEYHDVPNGLGYRSFNALYSSTRAPRKLEQGPPYRNPCGIQASIDGRRELSWPPALRIHKSYIATAIT